MKYELFEGVLEEDVVASRLLEAVVDDAAEDGPALLHVQVHLVRELDRLELMRAQNDVRVVLLRVHSRHVAAHKLKIYITE